jgi:hypothetical protein
MQIPLTSLTNGHPQASSFQDGERVTGSRPRLDMVGNLGLKFEGQYFEAISKLCFYYPSRWK